MATARRRPSLPAGGRFLIIPDPDVLRRLDDAIVRDPIHLEGGSTIVVAVLPPGTTLRFQSDDRTDGRIVADGGVVSRSSGAPSYRPRAARHAPAFTTFDALVSDAVRPSCACSAGPARSSATLYSLRDGTEAWNAARRSPRPHGPCTGGVHCWHGTCFWLGDGPVAVARGRRIMDAAAGSPSMTLSALVRAEEQGLDLNRLLFVKHLLLTGRLSEDVPDAAADEQATLFATPAAA